MFVYLCASSTMNCAWHSVACALLGHHKQLARTSLTKELVYCDFVRHVNKFLWFFLLIFEWFRWWSTDLRNSQERNITTASVYFVLLCISVIFGWCNIFFSLNEVWNMMRTESYNSQTCRVCIYIWVTNLFVHKRISGSEVLTIFMQI